MNTQLPVYLPGHEFIMPYIMKCIQCTPMENEARIAIMVSSTDIYQGSCENADETFPIDTSSPWHTWENEFIKMAAQANLRPLILRCANVIGTGMTGFPRELAERIAKGTFLHFPNNEAKISAVHASDLAQIITTVLRDGIAENAPSVINITDGEPCTIKDLAEAIAFRMNNKRISTLSTRPQQIMGRIFYGKRLYQLYTTTRTFTSSCASHYLPMTFTPVCQYMRTHVYDNESL